MIRLLAAWAAAFAALAVLGGCATRPINPPIQAVPADGGYSLLARQKLFKAQDNLVVLAFSGGGTRAAAFSYGALEFLRRTEIVGPNGERIRLLDGVDVITGVSGGSFTALAYGLYGEKLFDDYEQRFLKRDVQGELIARAFSPTNWGNLSSSSWGRSELAEALYDEILFNGATFGDLKRGTGPFIIVSATDLSSGARFPFTQTIFNVICSDVEAVPLSRAAAASSAVPVVLSPVTVNNYGGTCNFELPPWAARFVASANPPRPAARAIRELREAAAYGDGIRRPYLHLVDGGVSDNVAMRSVLDVMQLLEAAPRRRHPDAARSRPQDHRPGRQFAVLAPGEVGRVRLAPGHRRCPAEGGRRADRPLFLRGGRAVEGHLGAVADHPARCATSPGARSTRTRRCAARCTVPMRTSTPSTSRSPRLPTRPSATTSTGSRPRSSCPARPWTACAPLPERSSWHRPSSSGC